MSQSSLVRLYQEIKNKFTAIDGGIILISITSENVDELTPIFFEDAKIRDYGDAITVLEENKKSYAALTYEENLPVYYFMSIEFSRIECLATGKTLRYRPKPYASQDIDINQLKKELQQLGEMLRGNTKAS